MKNTPETENMLPIRFVNISVQLSFISAPPHDQNTAKYLKGFELLIDGFRKRKKQQTS